MFYVYVLWSEKRQRYYVGHTDNLSYRLQTHNLGQVKSTKTGTPWNLYYAEKHDTRSDAMHREAQIKRWKSRLMIEQLLPK